MITLPAKFEEANNQAEKKRDVLVMVEDATLYAEKTTETDWGNNAAESNVDYTSGISMLSPSAGDVILEWLDSYAAKTNLTAVRGGCSSVYYNGKVYVYGGWDSGGTPQSTLYEYDPIGNSWTTKTAGPVGVTNHISVIIGGKMYVQGGDSGGPNPESKVWEYDFAGDSWSTKTAGSTTQRFWHHAAVAYEGKLYTYGGAGGSGPSPVIQKNIWEYDPVGDSWTQHNTAGPARYSPTAILHESKMITFGGQSGSTKDNTTWEYDFEADTWTQKTSGATARAFHSAAYYAGLMYIHAGDSGAAPATNFLNDMWLYDIDRDVWEQQTSGGTVGGYTGMTATPTGEIYITGGYDISSVYQEHYEYTTGYSTSGNIETNNIDIGEVPTVAGEWVIEDIKPTGTTLTYTAEYSTTGAWGGEEVSIGTIYDGLAISVLARYWRVTSTLTTNIARDETPILQSIKVDYSTYRRFNRIPDLGYEALVEDVSSLTSKVDFFQPASIGQISVNLNMTDAVSDWVYGDTLYNKIVQVKLGFKYPGFVESDYIHYFTGAIDDWNVSDQTLNLTLKDLSKEWKLPVPSKWESAADNVTWTATHHTDIMLDIFQNYINVRDSGLLLDSFATVKAATPAYVVTRTITGKTEDAKKLVEELRVLLFAFFLPRGDGKIGIKQFDSTEAAATTFTDDNTLSIKWQANSKDLINRTSIYFNWDSLGDKEENFDSYDGGDDTTSQTNFQEIRPYILKDKWTKTAQASQISDLETKILAQFDNMPSTVTITCDAKDIAYEAGDMANVTTLEAPGSGGAGIIDEKYLITSKNLDFLGDRIVFKGLKVA